MGCLYLSSLLLLQTRREPVGLIGSPRSLATAYPLLSDWRCSKGPRRRHRRRPAGFYVVLRATPATPTVPRLTLWSPARRDFLVRKRRELRLFPFTRRRRGGLWLKMSAVPSSRNSLAISASAWNICRPSPRACTTVGSLASLSTSHVVRICTGT